MVEAPGVLAAFMPMQKVAKAVVAWPGTHKAIAMGPGG